MKITNVGIVGSGTMGSGIAQLFIQSGFNVVLYDIAVDIVEKAKDQVITRIKRLIEKGKIDKEEAEQVKLKLATTAHIEDLSCCQLIIEAAPEKIEIKKDLFEKLDLHCSEETILASNTSSFSITEIANCSKRPERVAGLHFFNPAPVMPLVEIVKGAQTSIETIESLKKIALLIGKTPVQCEDTPGFIVNRVARPFYNEAIKIFKEQIASIEQIDRIMKYAGHFKMGPFELQDAIGIDINFATTESVHQSFFGDARFRPHYYQQRMVQSGRVGRKAGAGYYEYE
ncbi:3-hydroxyacyl-CoA dehydrogenase NAD-binding domain-containing protein [Calidifontibacillus erzurumensis]|uniref:3-hydroxybutyryl-CoA dehydrogenase n=1 Tax=Calidifontibacillus erzurumensis TaxID=2741433 RepID=A0A8J8GBT2_9BACI|nr:3-hydroxyacyl-CoA dehydrogenase NAD-binding domain-containing protein [Calidifontibacillus erzurumensis]NSL50532.1 3-hydroxybutyryl-CoA dehydrogenase [Calidifontibacillus erzurumensis]